jgi:shikimate kinase
VAQLKQNGILIYLKTSPLWIQQRTKSARHRPLLNTGNPMAKITKLLKERQSFYEVADFTIETDGKTPRACGKEILRKLKLDNTTDQRPKT